MIYILLMINIILLVAGQTLWKIGMESVKLELSLSGIFKVIFQPYIFSGLVIYAVATVIWLYILSKSDLSLIYPLQSLCYVLAAFVGIIVFKEYIPPTRWFGIMLILLGAFFVAK
ncbi:hypothetical protein KQI89_16045 [Clostridium sp. MSJ-4]|uniref:EamA domain-containing protein n=1 Tax=Clostridium simiarum TaxID=2841506 RepID=A0ABS6F4N0_9CLOT|nr:MULTISPECIES: membrane protein [Clostridium]MBU5593261.1 hypothetical protein [Clostridium simiarum]